jgi:hypothetical protein
VGAVAQLRADLQRLHSGRPKEDAAPREQVLTCSSPRFLELVKTTAATLASASASQAGVRSLLEAVVRMGNDLVNLRNSLDSISREQEQGHPQLTAAQLREAVSAAVAPAMAAADARLEAGLSDADAHRTEILDAVSNSRSPTDELRAVKGELNEILGLLSDATRRVFAVEAASEDEVRRLFREELENGVRTSSLVTSHLVVRTPQGSVEMGNLRVSAPPDDVDEEDPFA